MARTKIKGPQVATKEVQLQAITSNSTLEAIEQTGWGYIQGNGTNFGTVTITFPVAFTTIKNVIIGTLGLTSTTPPAALGDFNVGYSGNIVSIQAYSITTTTMVVRYTLDSGATLASSLYAGFGWIAYGT